MVRRAIADATPYKLLIIDAQMPEMDGFELIRQLRALPLRTPPTVMMLSSLGRLVDTELCQQLNIQVYLSKPVSAAVLFDAILKAIGTASVETQPAFSKSQAPAERQGATILLAEDNLTNRKLVLKILEKHGYDVIAAENGAEALDAFDKQKVDLILMDVQMPVMDGLEATRAIRRMEAGRHSRIPILALTAHAMEGDREKCLNAGMDDYLTKPIQSADLLKKIQTLLAAETPSSRG